MREKKPPKVVFIDFDGTLVNSVPALYHAYEMFLLSQGGHPSLEEFTFLNGFSLREIVDYLIHRHQLQLPFITLYPLYQKKVAEEYVKEISLFSGAKEFLLYATQQGLRLVLVTSSQRVLVEPLLHSLTVFSLFERIVTADGLSKSKPDPAIFLLALQESAVTADEAIVIEDSPNGVAAAVAAGINTLVLRQLEKHFLLHIPPGPKVHLLNNWSEIKTYFSEKVL